MTDILTLLSDSAQPRLHISVAPLLILPDQYLDARQSEWAVDERNGRVRYDPMARVIQVNTTCAEIITTFTARNSGSRHDDGIHDGISGA